MGELNNMEKVMNEDLTNFENLWEHVTTFRPDPSVCMIKICQAITKSLSGGNPFKTLFNLEIQIGEHVDFEFYGPLMLSRVKGKWYITNKDLEFWGDMMLFGRRDYLQKTWKNFSSGIDQALHAKRRWQTFERYKSNGGLREKHRKLLSCLRWNMDLGRGDWISLYVQGKRPFGNSDIEGDIIGIVDWKYDEEDMPAEMIERCWELFDELQFAIIDVCADK